MDKMFVWLGERWNIGMHAIGADSLLFNPYQLERLGFFLFIIILFMVGIAFNGEETKK